MRLFPSRLVSIVIITSWFAIALDEIRTRRILREKTDCKQPMVESLYVTVIYNEGSDEKSEV